MAEASTDDYPLLWAPAMLADPQAVSSIRAYRDIVDSPPLGEEGFQELVGLIVSGKQADIVSRRLDISHTDDETSDLQQRMDLGNRAAAAVISRHLGLVAEIGCGSERGNWEETIAIGNLALTQLINAPDSPVSNPDITAVRFEHQVILTVMRAITGYHPHFRGYTVHDLEKYWQNEYGGVPKPKPLQVYYKAPAALAVKGLIVNRLKAGTPDFREGTVVLARADDPTTVLGFDKRAFAEFLEYAKNGMLDQFVV